MTKRQRKALLLRLPVSRKTNAGERNGRTLEQNKKSERGVNGQRYHCSICFFSLSIAAAAAAATGNNEKAG
jgi:hypothetical protein